MPSVFVQGRPTDSYPRLAPEARGGQVRRITEVGEEVLHKPCRDVTEFGPDLAALIDDMFLTMYIADGAGLAANQVDVDLRLFVYDCPDDDGIRHVGHIVNPVLEQSDPAGRRLPDDSEGRLSGPGAARGGRRHARTAAGPVRGPRVRQGRRAARDRGDRVLRALSGPRDRPCERARVSGPAVQPGPQGGAAPGGGPAGRGVRPPGGQHRGAAGRSG